MKKYVLLFFVVCFGIQPGYAIDPDYFKQMMWAATSTMCNAVWNFGKSYAGHAVSICSLGMAGYAIKQTRNMRNELGEEQKKYNSLEGALAEKASADRIVALEQALAEKADTNKIVALEKALAEKSGADQRKFLLLNIAVKTMGENIAANKSALADMNNELSTSYLVIEGTYESVFALIHQFLRMTPSSVSSEEFHEFKRGFSRFKKECALQASVTREKAKQTTMNQLKKKIEFVYHIYDKDLQKYDHKIRSLKQAMT
ncbi:MAG: hypothetical protein WA432_04480 [Candidatus Babeliaceae bacterium]